MIEKIKTDHHLCTETQQCLPELKENLHKLFLKSRYLINCPPRIATVIIKAHCYRHGLIFAFVTKAALRLKRIIYSECRPDGLGQCPFGCHGVLGCFTTIPGGGLGVAPMCFKCPATLKPTLRYDGWAMIDSVRTDVSLSCDSYSTK